MIEQAKEIDTVEQVVETRIITLEENAVIENIRVEVENGKN